MEVIEDNFSVNALQECNNQRTPGSNRAALKSKVRPSRIFHSPNTVDSPSMEAVKRGLERNALLTPGQLHDQRKFDEVIAGLEPDVASFLMKTSLQLAIEVENMAGRKKNQMKFLESRKKKISRKFGLRIFNRLASTQISEAEYLSKIQKRKSRLIPPAKKPK